MQAVTHTSQDELCELEAKVMVHKVNREQHEIRTLRNSRWKLRYN